MVLISHLMVLIEWVPYPQKECGYCRMTPIHFFNKKRGKMANKLIETKNYKFSNKFII